MQNLPDKLYPYWKNSLPQFPVHRSAILSSYHQIITRYSEPHRTYHTLNHIHHIFQKLDRLSHPIHDRTSLTLAIWLHDIIYNPKAKDNEQQSAHFAHQLLTPLQIPDRTLHTIQTLILTTQHHNPNPYSTDQQILCDLDLAILGSPPKTYRQYAQAIRSEYAWIPQPDYCQGRIQILKTFLNRDRLYHIPELRDRYETQARQNLQQEITRFAEVS